MKEYVIIKGRKIEKKDKIDLKLEENGFYGIRVRERGNEKNVLFIDTNIGLDHALGLAKSGFNVWYSVIHSRAFPNLIDEINGYGFNEIKKVWDWGEGLENGCETIVFADSGFGALADWLRLEGYDVFGADGNTERLELDRVFFKKIMDKLGIKTPAYYIAKGVEEAKKIVKEKGEKYVKVSRFRGAVETFKAHDEREIETKIKTSDFAMFGDIATFVLEEPVGDGFIEIGFDALFNGERFLDIVFDTIEKKGEGNITFAREIDKSPWYTILKKFEPYLRKNGYRGFFCAEGFWNGKDIYVIDITPRFAYICSYAYPRMIENYGDVIVNVAKGKDVEIKLKTKVSVQISAYTDVMKWKEVKSDNWQMTAMRRAVKIGQSVWWVPIEDNTVAVAVGLGHTDDEAMRKAIDVAEGIEFDAMYHGGHRLKYLYEKDKVMLNEFGYYG